MTLSESRITAITSGFQPEDEGSTPFSRSLMNSPWTGYAEQKIIMVSEKLLNRLLYFAEDFARVNDFDLATGKRNNPDEDTAGRWTDPEHIRETIELVKFQMEKEKKERQKLPSRFQNRDIVSVYLNSETVIPRCKVTKVAFSDSKVFYDVEVVVGVDIDQTFKYTRLHSIDSAHVDDPLESRPVEG